MHTMVGLAGFEPAASASRTQRATKLRHNPLYIVHPEGFEPPTLGSGNRCSVP